MFRWQQFHHGLTKNWSLHGCLRLHFALVVCLFNWLGVFDPLENFSLIWRRKHCRWRAANFDLWLALMAIEQWGFFNVPHLLWHGPTVYNVHLRGPVTLTPYPERLTDSGAVTTCFYDLGLSRPRIEPRSPACEANALPLHAAVRLS